MRKYLLPLVGDLLLASSVYAGWGTPPGDAPSVRNIVGNIYAANGFRLVTCQCPGYYTNAMDIRVETSGDAVPLDITFLPTLFTNLPCTNIYAGGYINSYICTQGFSGCCWIQCNQELTIIPWVDTNRTIAYERIFWDTALGSFPAGTYIGGVDSTGCSGNFMKKFAAGGAVFGNIFNRPYREWIAPPNNLNAYISLGNFVVYTAKYVREDYVLRKDLTRYYMPNCASWTGWYTNASGLYCFTNASGWGYQYKEPEIIASNHVSPGDVAIAMSYSTLSGHGAFITNRLTTNQAVPVAVWQMVQAQDTWINKGPGPEHE